MNIFRYGVLSAGLSVAAFTGIALSQQQGTELNVFAHKMNPHGDSVPAGGTTALSPITAHGGPVMAGTPNVYLIWYGDWNQNNGSDTPAGQALVNTFLTALSGSGYMNTNTTYYASNGGVSGNFTVAGSMVDSYSQTKRLTDSKVQTIVSSAIASGKLGAADTNGIYFVLTSTDVSESSGFCSRYCGWHTYGTIAGTNIKYSFVGNANRCLSGCAAQTISPNGNAGVDGMISVIAHELEEAIS
ncbi:MAG TPA: hypothetical protein VNH18_32415, partial [Bryobacteraceae bacterium]|nr:hypothetical protein [Bryobacteraceae bacterium]